MQHHITLQMLHVADIVHRDQWWLTLYLGSSFSLSLFCSLRKYRFAL